MLKQLTSGLAAAAALLAAQPLGAHGGVHTVYRSAALPFGPATVESWITLDDHGKPLEIGFAMAEAGMAAMAEAPDLALSVPLPPQAAATGFDHIYLTWNPFGHPPAGLFDLPHFDVHFYLQEDAARAAIEPTDPEFWAKAAREPDRAYMPADYVPPPEVEPVPTMGVHWVDATDPVFQGEPFDQVFIYGAWDGVVTFLEPMITLDVFNSKETIVAEVKQPALVGEPGFYPRRYRIGFDDERQAHVVVLEELHWRVPTAAEGKPDGQAALRP